MPRGRTLTTGSLESPTHAEANKSKRQTRKPKNTEQRSPVSTTGRQNAKQIKSQAINKSGGNSSPSTKPTSATPNAKRAKAKAKQKAKPKRAAKVTGSQVSEITSLSPDLNATAKTKENDAIIGSSERQASAVTRSQRLLNRQRKASGENVAESSGKTKAGSKSQSTSRLCNKDFINDFNTQKLLCLS